MTEENGPGTEGMEGSLAGLTASVDEFIQQIQAEGIGDDLVGFTARLRDACSELEQRPSRINPSVDAANRPLSPWLHADVYRVFNLETFAALARDAYRRRKKTSWVELLRNGTPLLELLRKGALWVELFRNVLIFVPILLTWAALSDASYAYANALQHDPALYYVPFLSQWETYFSGYMKPFLGFIPIQFSAVAFYDFVLIFFIILLTALLHVINDQWHEGKERKIADWVRVLERIQWGLVVAVSRQRGEYYDNAEQRSYAMLGRIDRFVAEFRRQGEDTIRQFQEQGLATLRALHDQSSETLGELARQGQAQHKDLVEKSRDLLDRMAAEQKRLTRWAESLRDNFKDTQSISADFRAGMEALKGFAPALKATLDDLAASSRALAGDAGKLEEHEARLADALQGLDGSLAVVQEVVNVLSKDLGQSAEKVAGAASAYGEKLGAINALVQQLGEAIRRIAAGQTTLQETIVHNNAMTFGWADQAQRATQSISESQQSMARYAERLDGLAAVFGALEAAERQLDEHMLAAGTGLADVKAELNAWRRPIELIAAAAGEVQRIESEFAQRLATVSAQLDSIGAGLAATRQTVADLGERDLASLSGRNAEVGRELSRLSEAVTRLQGDLFQWQTATDRSTESSQRLTEEMASLRTALPDLVARRNGDGAGQAAE